MIREINVNIQGNFSCIKRRNEYKFLNKFYSESGILHIETKMKKAGNKKFTQNVTLCGTGLIFNDTESIELNGRFLGCVKEVENGFIPANSVNSYHYKRVYKTFEGAKNALINKKYKETEKRCFGYLAQQKFYYSDNYLQGLSLTQISLLIEQFTSNLNLSVRIVKKFLKSDIIDYYGQGGYKTATATIL